MTHIVEQNKTLIELTRRKEHLDLPSGILNDKLTQLLSVETIKDGTSLQGVITDVSLESSCPIQVQISPFVNAKILFSEVFKPEQLQKFSLTKILAQYKAGQQIELVYRGG